MKTSSSQYGLVANFMYIYVSESRNLGGLQINYYQLFLV